MDLGLEFLNFTSFVQLLTYKVPWLTPGVSYCHWWGVTCCLTSSELVLPSCTQGFQSVGELTLSGISQLVKRRHSIVSFANQTSLNVSAQQKSNEVPDLHLLLHASAVSATLVSSDYTNNMMSAFRCKHDWQGAIRPVYKPARCVHCKSGQQLG